MTQRPLLTAAVLSVLATGAFAQTRVDRSGATDANSRVGSGGRNVTGGREAPWVQANRVVYGTTTGGQQFRGPTASTDPQAFRGFSASRNSDTFIRDSAGVTTGGFATYNSNQTRPYYGDSRNVAPPANTVGVRTLGSYSPPTPTAWTPIDPRAAAVSVGNTTVVNTPNANTLVSGGEVNLQAGVNGLGGATDAGINSVGQLSDYTNLNSRNTANLTPSQIKQMQGDSPNSQLPGQTNLNNATGTSPADTGPQQAQPAGTPLNGSGGTPGGQTPGNTPRPGAVPNSGASPVNTSEVNTGIGNVVEPGSVTRMTKRAGQADNKPDAAGTAGQNAAADNAPDRPGLANERANREYNQQVRQQKKAADAKQNADQPGPAGDKAPAGGTAPDAGNTPAPNRSGTFGSSTEAGVGDILTKAEEQMKAGKFASAIDTYSAAESVAPRSATVKLGRANAELGGAFYRRAAGTLRQAYDGDAKLLANQYDLRGFLGDDRLGAIQKDLADLVQARPTETDAAVLLAYVYYNTGNERRAGALLDLADKRADGRDATVKAMKATWKTGDETK